MFAEGASKIPASPHCKLSDNTLSRMLIILPLLEAIAASSLRLVTVYGP